MAPVASDRVRYVLPTYNRRNVSRFFEKGARGVPNGELPALRPDDLAAEMALRLIDNMGPGLRGAVIDVAAEYAPLRLRARLESLWRDRTLTDRGDGAEHGVLETLTSLQSRLDETRREDVDALHRLVYASATACFEAKELAAKLDHLAELRSLLSGRPFDPALSTWYAGAVDTCAAAAAASHDHPVLEGLMVEVGDALRRPILREDANVMGTFGFVAVTAAQEAHARGDPADVLRWAIAAIAPLDDESLCTDEMLRRQSQALHLAAQPSAAAGDWESMHRILDAQQTCMFSIKDHRPEAARLFAASIHGCLYEVSAKPEQPHLACLGQYLDSLLEVDDASYSFLGLAAVLSLETCAAAHMTRGEWAEAARRLRAVDTLTADLDAEQARETAPMRLRVASNSIIAGRLLSDAKLVDDAKARLMELIQTIRPNETDSASVTLAFASMAATAALAGDQGLAKETRQACVAAMINAGWPDGQIPTPVAFSILTFEAAASLAGTGLRNAMLCDIKSLLEGGRLPAAQASSFVGGMLSALHGFGSDGELQRMDEWGGWLLDIADDPRHSIGEPDQTRIVTRLFCPMAHHSMFGNIVEMEGWGSEFIERSSRLDRLSNPDVRRAQGRAARMALQTYRIAGITNLQRTVFWQAQLRAALEALPDDEDMRNWASD